MNELTSSTIITKRMMVSNIAKIFDVLGWFCPIVIKVKILLQRLWELKIEWDDQIPSSTQETWLQWRSELPLLYVCHIPRYHFPKDVKITSVQLHGFCDASEDAYAGVVYLRGEDSSGGVHISLVTAKTKVSPIKRLTIPRLELCGAQLLSKLLHHVKEIYQIPTEKIYAWTDSTIVLNWLDGSPRRFKTYVGNRVSVTISHIPSKCWNHVSGVSNPADRASRGIFPNELVDHELWWQGPRWLRESQLSWPTQSMLPPNDISAEEKEICLTSRTIEPVIPLIRYSVFPKLQRVTAWIFRFVNNCRKTSNPPTKSLYLFLTELSRAERYWLSVSQNDCFTHEISALKSNQNLSSNSSLKSLGPFLDTDGLIRVGGRLSNSNLPYDSIHPIVLHGNHYVTKLIIKFEHHRLLHASQKLVSSSISHRFHIVSLRKNVRSIIRSCITCKRHTGKTSFQLQGQLPTERVTPGCVFEKVGVDYAGPLPLNMDS